MYIKKILWAIALMGLFIFGGIAYYIYTAMFQSNTKFNANYIDVFISSNTNYFNVRKQLQPHLESINTFDALAKQKKYVTNIKSGRYRIFKGMNNNDIITILRSRNKPVQVSFNNQNTLEKLAGRISQQIEADSVVLLEVMRDAVFLKQAGFTQATALGMYLPNSYEFFWNTSAEKFRARMYKEYIKYWTEARKSKAKQRHLSPNEVMILAAIVHEESKQPNEQPRVAGVYLNRLKIGMRLDADPTIKFAAYQLPKYENTVIKRVLNAHKEIDSPYNTYKKSGLPPGLIAMPDLSAIDAVLHSEKHKYLYFVADKDKPGYHKFSRTLSIHNKYARQYHNYLNTKGMYK